jgi:hypothetical protein
LPATEPGTPFAGSWFDPTSSASLLQAKIKTPEAKIRQGNRGNQLVAARDVGGKVSHALWVAELIQKRDVGFQAIGDPQHARHQRSRVRVDEGIVAQSIGDGSAHDLLVGTVFGPRRAFVDQTAGRKRECRRRRREQSEHHYRRKSVFHSSAFVTPAEVTTIPYDRPRSV